MPDQGSLVFKTDPAEDAFKWFGWFGDTCLPVVILEQQTILKSYEDFKNFETRTCCNSNDTIAPGNIKNSFLSF